MPIKIPNDLPARKVLEAEGVMVMDEDRAVRQDIRPLQIGLLNLMPNKERTETQFARLIGATPLQIDLTLVRISGHQSKNTPQEHLESFYKTWDEVKHRKFDGFIVTGAPIAHLEFEDVGYWEEMKEIMDWTRTNVFSTMFVCWGAQAALHYFHDVQRFRRPKKAFGVYRHQAVAKASKYLLGFSDDFAIPVSRINDIDEASVPKNLEILVSSSEVGLCLLDDAEHRQLFMLNHLEYDHRSLAEEYIRDKEAGLDTPPPVNTFPQDDVTKEPLNRWRSHAYLLFSNWINQIYQDTPYDLNELGQSPKS